MDRTKKPDSLAKRFGPYLLMVMLSGCVSRGALPPSSGGPDPEDAIRSEIGDHGAFSDTEKSVSSPDANFGGGDDGGQGPDGTTTKPGVCEDPMDCPCKETQECEFYDKQDLCGGVHLCIDGACVLQNKTAITCPLHIEPCKAYACDPDFGLCIEYEKTNGDPCDDEDPCTANDICLVKECSGDPITCEDNNPCTHDICVLGDCENKSICDDNNPCTEDLCNETGDCVFNDILCDDEDVCTQEECSAEAGKCVYTQVVCEDGDSCTDDLCLPDSGCSYVDNGSCDVTFSVVDEAIFQVKCVPCHSTGGTKRNFVGQASKMDEIPQIAQCQNLPNGLPYTLAACIYWLTTQSLAMPPPWYQAETLLPDTWTQISYEGNYSLETQDQELLEDWADQGFAQ